MRRLREVASAHLGSLALALLILTAVSSGVKAATDSGSGSILPTNMHQLPGPQATVSMPSELLSSNPDAVRMRFFDPPLEMGATTIGGSEYQTITMSGESNTSIPGVPDLPRVTRLIMVSNTGNMQVVITSQSYTEEFIATIAPAQPMEGDDEMPAEGYSLPSASIYSRNEWYPPVVAQISAPATLRDVRFVVLTIYPVQVNPVTGQMRVYDNIEVEIENVGGVGINEITHVPTSISPTFKRLYRSFENFAGSALDELPVLPGKYLLICGNDAMIITEAQKLVTWRRRKGVDASYVTTATIGGSDATTVRNYIATQYNNSNGQLEYVCLMGDPQGSGVFNIGTHSSQYDNYFGTMTGGPNPDPVPDIAIGRISGSSSDAFAAIVNKTVNYESNPYLTDDGWFTRTWCAAHTSYIGSNPSFKEYTRQIMLQHGIGSVFWNTYVSRVSVTDIQNRLTTGISCFNHRMSWISQMYNSDLDGAPVTQMLPFVMSMTCGTGNFDTGVALSEAWMAPYQQGPNSPKGAIGCVGLHGSSTHVPYNNILDAGAMYGLYVQGVEEQGVINIAGKLQLYRNYWGINNSAVQNFCYWANLMGDPGVPVWHKKPRVVSVTVPDSINLGTNNVNIQVSATQGGQPIPDALVCLWKGSETFKRGYTNAAGQINLPCSTATTGNLILTITKNDVKAVLDTIRVVNAAASLSFNGITVDDDNSGGTIGDNNHVLNPGETVDLIIAIRNSGTSQTVTGISGTLTTSSPGIQITQATSTYPNIGVGQSMNPAVPYRIVVSSVFNSQAVTFFLNLTSSVGAQTVRVDLTPVAGDVTYVSNTFYGPGGNLDPGESGEIEIRYQNSGQRALISSNGLLRSLDPYVLTTDSLGTYGTVAAGASATNTTDRFALALSSGAYNGHRALMQLIITDANGFRDSTSFYLTIGTQASTSPTGPDAYGYYAFDNTETAPQGGAATYSWIELYPTPGTSLNFNDQAENGDQTSVITLPFTFTFYGQSFTQISICTNGWLSFGATTIIDFRNYRMGSPIGPPNQVAAYWDDLKAWGTANNVYYWYDSANHLFVVEWRARTLWTNLDEIFEVILYDPAYYPSSTGDGKIKIQYNTVNLSPNHDENDNDYASIGIQNADHSIGLDYYYWNIYAPGSATITAGRAIMITTDATGSLNPVVRVTQPNGGENWYIGQTYNLLWQSTAVFGQVNISINRTYPSASWTTLFSGTVNDGVEPWTVVGPASPTTRIRVISVNQPAVGDTSDANFNLIMPTVTLTTPNGGEVFATGTPTAITWNQTGLGPVRVDLNRSYPSANWETLAASAPDGLEWIVTGPPTTTARVRVVGISVPTVGDTSNANFTIGVPPVIQHGAHADLVSGPATFTAYVTDDVGGFVTKLFYRVLGVGNYDSLTMNPTGNPNEYSCTTPSLSVNRYEYYLRCTDAQFLSAFYPASGTQKFDVGYVCPGSLFFDDGVAENYNWVQGGAFQWAVKFDPGTYPYVLSGGRFAICPSCISPIHGPIVFRVYSANGPGGLPGTVLYVDSTGTPGNVVGGLPSGAAWADAVTRSGGQPLQLNAPFYLSVENIGLTNAVAFATDTSAARQNRSYYYDACDGAWYLESSGQPNARPGDRMIRAVGWILQPPTVTVIRSGNDALIQWYSVGAPYYKVFSSTNPLGPFDTLEGTVTGTPNDVLTAFTDTGAINDPTVKRFYQVRSTDAP